MPVPEQPCVYFLPKGSEDGWRQPLEAAVIVIICMTTSGHVSRCALDSFSRNTGDDTTMKRKSFHQYALQHTLWKHDVQHCESRQDVSFFAYFQSMNISLPSDGFLPSGPSDRYLKILASVAERQELFSAVS